VRCIVYRERVCDPYYTTLCRSENSFFVCHFVIVIDRLLYESTKRVPCSFPFVFVFLFFVVLKGLNFCHQVSWLNVPSLHFPPSHLLHQNAFLFLFEPNWNSNSCWGPWCRSEGNEDEIYSGTQCVCFVSDDMTRCLSITPYPLGAVWNTHSYPRSPRSDEVQGVVLVDFNVHRLSPSESANV